MKVTRPFALAKLLGASMLLAGLGLPGMALGEARETDASARESGAAVPAGSASADPAPPPTVNLDRLLRLPTAYYDGANRYGGAGPSEWRTRFAEARAAIERARRELAETQEQLGHTAADSSQWQMGAPGLGNPDPEHSTVSHKLRSQVRTLREGMVAAERQLKDLDIEADLVGVPQPWRRPEGQAAPGEVDEAYEFGTEHGKRPLP